MLVDARLAAQILSQHQKVQLLEEHVLLYRSYLYIKKEHAHMAGILSARPGVTPTPL
jgi:hypothetical protein